jgi:PAS domain S-box-containing protein
LLHDRERLRESEEKFRQVSASAQDAIIILDQDGAVTDWNAAAEKIFGYAAAEAVGMDLHARLAPPRQRGAAAQGLRQFRDSGTGPVINKTLELAALRRDGTEFPIELSISSAMLRGRWHAIGMVRDISERKRAEQAALGQFKLAEAFFSHSVSGLVILDRNFNFVRVNEAYARAARKQIGEFAGRNHFDMYPSDAQAIFEEVVRSKRPYTTFTRAFVYPDQPERGTTYWDWTLVPILDEQGEVEYLVFSLQEVTERKRAEEVRTQLAAIVQSSHDAIIGKDLEGVITSWNPGAEKVYGYRAEEVVGKPVSALAPQGRKVEIAALLDRVRQGEGVMNFETERFRRDGERIDVSLDLSPIRDAAGRITGVSTIARDITEKKQAERALRKLNRALKALSSCNETLIHASDEMQLLNDICRIIVDIEGYHLAWVGYVEHDANKTVRPVAQRGYDPGYMEHADITWADNERGRGPLGIAIRSGEVQVVQDVNADPRFEPWRANAARLSYGSVLVAPLLSGSGVIGALNIHGDGVDAFDPAEIALLGELAADMAFGIVTLRTRRAQDESAARLQHSMESTIQAIAGTVEMRDPYTAGHQRRVAELATAIARDLGLAEDRVRGVHLAGVVHDLGKIHIPAEILSKPGKLSRLEFELIKSHPEAGYEILKGVDFPWPIAQIVLQHHERLDGSGYPRGLKADEILLEARILAVADVVEAMSSHRPYRPSLGIEPALQEVGANTGTRYDADVVRACLALFREKAFAFKS